MVQGESKQVRPRRRYTSEFKAEAVRLVATGGKPLAQIARELGINEQTLHNWKKRATSGNGTGLAPDHFAQQEELRRLRRENARLKEERDILKKATAFFANPNR